jgi:hypothetical protein
VARMQHPERLLRPFDAQERMQSARLFALQISHHDIEIAGQSLPGFQRSKIPIDLFFSMRGELFECRFCAGVFRQFLCEKRMCGHRAVMRIEFEIDARGIPVRQPRRSQHGAVDIETPGALIFHQCLHERDRVDGSADGNGSFIFSGRSENMPQDVFGRDYAWIDADLEYLLGEFHANAFDIFCTIFQLRVVMCLRSRLPSESIKSGVPHWLLSRLRLLAHREDDAEAGYEVVDFGAAQFEELSSRSR